MKAKFVTILVLLGVMVASPTAAQQGSRLFPPNSNPYQKAYKRWAGQSSVWFNEIPARGHPYRNLTPRSCRRHQKGKVWFLVLVPPGGRCVIPAKRAILAVGPFWECSTAEGHGRTYDRLRRCATNGFRRDFGRKAFKLRIELDGRPLKRIRRWTYTTPGETFDFPRKNLWEAQPGPSKSVSRGIFFMLRPLSPGRHSFRTRASFGDRTDVFVTRIRSVRQ